MEFPPNAERWRGLIRQILIESGADPSLTDKTLWTLNGESGGDPNARGDGGIAVGLFQIQARPEWGRPSVEWLLNPENNIRYAIQQLGIANGDFSAWGEGVTYNGQVFGALGHNPFPGENGRADTAGGITFGEGGATPMAVTKVLRPADYLGAGATDQWGNRAFEDSAGNIYWLNAAGQLWSGGSDFSALPSSWQVVGAGQPFEGSTSGDGGGSGLPIPDFSGGDGGSTGGITYTQGIDTDGSVTGIPGAVYQRGSNGGVSILSRPDGPSAAADRAGGITWRDGVPFYWDPDHPEIPPTPYAGFGGGSGVDPDGDGYDNSTNLPVGVVRVDKSISPTGLVYQGKPVNADGSLYTGSGSSGFAEPPDVKNFGGNPYIWDPKQGMYVPAPIQGFTPEAPKGSAPTVVYGSPGGDRNLGGGQALGDIEYDILMRTIKKTLGQNGGGGTVRQSAAASAAQMFAADQAAADRAFQERMQRKALAQQERQSLRQYGLSLDQLALSAADAYAQHISDTDPAAFDAFLGAGGDIGPSDMTIANALAIDGNTAVSEEAMKPAAQFLRKSRSAREQADAINRQLGGTIPMYATGTEGGGGMVMNQNDPFVVRRAQKLRGLTRGGQQPGGGFNIPAPAPTPWTVDPGTGMASHGGGGMTSFAPPMANDIGFNSQSRFPGAQMLGAGYELPPWAVGAPGMTSRADNPGLTSRPNPAAARPFPNPGAPPRLTGPGAVRPFPNPAGRVPLPPGVTMERNRLPFAADSAAFGQAAESDDTPVDTVDVPTDGDEPPDGMRQISKNGRTKFEPIPASDPAPEEEAPRYKVMELPFDLPSQGNGSVMGRVVMDMATGQIAWNPATGEWGSGLSWRDRPTSGSFSDEQLMDLFLNRHDQLQAFQDYGNRSFADGGPLRTASSGGVSYLPDYNTGPIIPERTALFKAMLDAGQVDFGYVDPVTGRYVPGKDEFSSGVGRNGGPAWGGMDPVGYLGSPYGSTAAQEYTDMTGRTWYWDKSGRSPVLRYRDGQPTTARRDDPPWTSEDVANAPGGTIDPATGRYVPRPGTYGFGQYATGTQGGHPGGPFIAGDSLDAAPNPELVQMPGQPPFVVSEPTLMSGPPGTNVIPFRRDMRLRGLSRGQGGIPAYARGTRPINGGGGTLGGQQPVPPAGAPPITKPIDDYRKSPPLNPTPAPPATPKPPTAGGGGGVMPPAPKPPAGDAPMSDADWQALMDEVYDTRTGAQYRDLDPYDPRWPFVAPTVRERFLKGRQARYGVPVEDQLAEINRYALRAPGIRAGY